MTSYHPPLLAFAGFSGAGKTTLLEKIIPLLKSSNIRVGLIKHSHHHIEMDKPNKDSFRLRHAGCDQLLLATKERHFLFFEYPMHEDKDREPSLEECIQQLNTAQLDLILVEGFRDACVTKIEVNRSQHNKPYLFPNDNMVIAIAADHLPTIPSHRTLDILDLNDADQIAKYVKHWLDNMPC